MSTTLVLTFATSEQKETFMRHFLYFKCLEILTFAILLCLALAPSPGLASPGDVTGDGVANIVDLQCTIVSSLNVLAGIGAAPDCVFGEDYMADHDCSGTVDVSDVLISIQVGLGAPLSKELDADSDGCPDACSGKPQCIGLPKTEFFQLSCIKNNRPGDRRCFNDASGGSIMVCADSGDWELFDECGSAAHEYCKDLGEEAGSLLLAQCECYYPDCSHCAPDQQTCWLNDAGESIVATCSADGSQFEESDVCDAGELCTSDDQGQHACQTYNANVDQEAAAAEFAMADFSGFKPAKKTSVPTPVPNFAPVKSPASLQSSAEAAVCDGGPQLCEWQLEAYQVALGVLFVPYVRHTWRFTRTGPQGEANVDSPCVYQFEGYGVGGGLTASATYQATFHNVEAPCTWPMDDGQEVNTVLATGGFSVPGTPLTIGSQWARIEGPKGTPESGGDFIAVEVAAPFPNNLGYGALSNVVRLNPFPGAIATTATMTYDPSNSNTAQCGVAPDPGNCQVGDCGYGLSCENVGNNHCRCRCEDSQFCEHTPERSFTCEDPAINPSDLISTVDAELEIEQCSHPDETCVDGVGCEPIACGLEGGLCCPENQLPNGEVCTNDLHCCQGWQFAPGGSPPGEPDRCGQCNTEGSWAGSSEAEANCKCCDGTSYLKSTDNDGTEYWHCGDKPGCTDAAASNHDPAATVDDGSCIYWDCTVDSDCDDGDECTVDTCDTASGSCLNDPVALFCDDGDNCNGFESCDPGTGACINDGTALDCDDNDACTTDSCEPGTGTCTNDPVALFCDDGDNCNGFESCDPGTGACINDGAVMNCDDGDACTADSCDAASGSCINDLGAFTCDDGDLCNGYEFCDPATGACIGDGAVMDCDDNDECTVDTCDTASGSCLNDPVALFCDDGDNCNGFESCDPGTGACINDGTALDCDDNDACTTDSCEPGTGTCTNDPVALFCDDGDNCNGFESCDPGTGACINDGAVMNCDDGDACTADSCDAASGSCINDLGAFTCDDGDLCNGYEFCDPATGACIGDGAVMNCDDNDACTTDSCEPGTGTCNNDYITGCSAP
jgi:hypothetical protein